MVAEESGMLMLMCCDVCEARKDGKKLHRSALPSHCKTAQQERESRMDGPLSLVAKASTDASVWGEGGASAVIERHSKMKPVRRDALEQASQTRSIA